MLLPSLRIFDVHMVMLVESKIVARDFRGARGREHVSKTRLENKGTRLAKQGGDFSCWGPSNSAPPNIIVVVCKEEAMVMISS